MLGVSLGWQVPGVAASAADPQASELVRLINGSRNAAGKASLVVDTTLASLARDGQIPCPDTTSQAIAGRAEDFATYDYINHNLRNCLSSTVTFSTTTFISILQSHFGYGSVGENTGMNSGYGTGKYLYSYKGWSTWTYSSSGHLMGTSTTGWMSSSSHWNIVMGGYNRVGCGGWALGGAYFYDCLFSIGGPGATVAPPTRSPFGDPLPTAAPTKAPVVTRAPTRAPVVAATPTPIPSATATAIPPSLAPSEAVAGMIEASPSPNPSPSPSPSLSPTSGPAAAAQLDDGAGNRPDSAPIWRDAVLRAGPPALSALLLIAAGGLALKLRRRRGSDPAS